MERWKARFKVANFLVEKPWKFSYDIRKVLYELAPNGDDTIIDIQFDSETSKPPLLQKAMSSILVSRIMDILTCVTGVEVEAQLLCLEPADKHAQEVFDGMKEPQILDIKPKLTKISLPELKKIERMWNKLYAGNVVGPMKQVIDNNLLFTMLRWYGKAKESVFQTDKFISLWVIFNMLYNYTWNRDNKQPEHREPNKIKHFVEKSDLLSPEECKEIITSDPNLLYKVLPEYEFLGSKEAWEEAVRTKDIKALEEGHKKYIDFQRKELGLDPTKFLRNKYGLEFGKFYLMEDWLHAMNEVLLFVYGIRNIVFHEGVTPREHVDGILFSDAEESAFWYSIIKILDVVDRIAICKIFEDNQT